MMGPDSHEDWQELIPEYLSGVLSGDEKASLELHLAGCTGCRRVLDDARRFHAGLGHLAKEAQSNHPTSAQITEYAAHPENIETSLREIIARHLALCPRCAGEVATLTDVAKELAASPTGEEPFSASVQFGRPATVVLPGDARGRKPRETTGLTAKTTMNVHLRVRPGIVYAIAAVFVALLAYPAYRWLALPTSTDSSVVGTVFNLAPQTRGGLRPTEIHVPPSAHAVNFALSVSSFGDYQPRLCVLESKSRELLRMQVATAPSGDQAFLVSVPPNLLSEGEYMFKLIGVNQTNASDTLLVQYPFIVRPDRP